MKEMLKKPNFPNHGAALAWLRRAELRYSVFENQSCSPYLIEQYMCNNRAQFIHDYIGRQYISTLNSNKLYIIRLHSFFQQRLPFIVLFVMLVAS